VEIQVRTIFEEAWAEIDHQFRYPNDPNDPYLEASLIILNGMAGTADMLGTLIGGLDQERQKREKAARSTKQSLAPNLTPSTPGMFGPSIGLTAHLTTPGVEAAMRTSGFSLTKPQQIPTSIQMATCSRCGNPFVENGYLTQPTTPPVCDLCRLSTSLITVRLPNK
jgi:hypothetical protein